MIKTSDLANALNQRGQDQSPTEYQTGFFIGVVEDNRDPFGIGRCKIRVFSIHGAKDRLDTRSLPWANPVFSNGYSVPEIQERVWVTWENGIRYNPVYIGRFLAVPAGRGKTSVKDMRQGTEVPREVWLHNNLKPTASMIAHTREGLSVWTEEHPFADSLFSRFIVQDSSGRSIEIKTRLPGSDYDEKQQVKDENKTERRKKELIYLEDKAKVGSIRIGHPGMQDLWETTIDHTTIRRRETRDGLDSQKAIVTTDLDASLSHTRMGGRGSDQSTFVKSNQDWTFASPSAMAVVTKDFLSLPAEW